MQLDQNQLQKLLAFLAESDIQEFRFECDEFRLEVRRNILYSTSSMLDKGNSEDRVIGDENTYSKSEGDPTLIDITSPMVGIFYRAPAPGEPKFVELGDPVSTGQTVCVLEAMKLMNELESEVNGVIAQILVENGAPVEFGQVLMRVSSQQ